MSFINPHSPLTDIVIIHIVYMNETGTHYMCVCVCVDTHRDSRVYEFHTLTFVPAHAHQSGDTGLHKASIFGHAAVVQELLKGGADAAAKNNVSVESTTGRACRWRRLASASLFEFSCTTCTTCVCLCLCLCLCLCRYTQREAC